MDNKISRLTGPHPAEIRAYCMNSGIYIVCLTKVEATALILQIRILEESKLLAYDKARALEKLLKLDDQAKGLI